MKRHSTQILPEGYREIINVNLQKDKKTALIVNIAGLVIFIGGIALAHFAFVPITLFLDDSDGLIMMLVRASVMLTGYIAYIILHELTHAAAMKLFNASKLRFGFTGLYAYAGSEYDYFDKFSYIVVALAPVVIWGIIFTVLLILVPKSWFWTIYFLQLGNVAGAVGDFYVTLKFLPLPKDILVRDTGIEMFVYSK